MRWSEHGAGLEKKGVEALEGVNHGKALLLWILFRACLYGVRVWFD